MNILAYILVLGMVFLGLNRYSELITPLQQEEELCMMDCCCNHEDADQQQCQTGCDCSSCYHIVAITYHFLTNFAIKAQRADYGSYLNSYHFECLTPHFQPPRFS